MPAGSDESRLCISVLGPPEVRAGGHLLPLSARKDLALLAILALAPERSVSRARLACLLWGESAEANARDSLKQAVRRIRRAVNSTVPDAIVSDRQSVALSSEVETDLDRVLSAGSEAEAERAITLRRGPLLDGLEITEPAFHDWLLTERARVDAAFETLALAVMRRSETAGKPEIAAEAARRIHAANPLNEEAVRLLMRRHASRGERGRAIELFTQLRDRLARDVAAEPEAATSELFDDLRRRKDKGTAAPPSDVVAPTRSLLVLPFANIGDDLSQDYFALGLAHDISTNLARVQGLMVASPEVVGHLRSGREPVEAARLLGLRYALAGSVRRDGGRIRVTARLIEAESGLQVWAARYDRDLADVLSVQDELSSSVAGALRQRFLHPEESDPARSGTEDARAHEFYLKARSFHLRGNDGRSLEIARALYLRAIECDPSYARALAQLAICESHLSLSRTPPAGSEEGDLCLAHAERALAVDPHLSEAHAALGLSFYAAGRYGDAERPLDVAMRLNPMFFEACFFQGRNRRLQGRRREAADLFERSASLRATDYRSVGLLSEELRALGLHERAMAAAATCLERLEVEIDTHPENADALAFGSAVLASLGRLDQAQEWAKWSLALGAGQRLVHYNVARTWMMLGRADDALNELERAFETSPVVRRRLALWMEFDLDLVPIRDHPRFLRLSAARDTTRGA